MDNPHETRNPPLFRITYPEEKRAEVMRAVRLYRAMSEEERSKVILEIVKDLNSGEYRVQ